MKRQSWLVLPALLVVVIPSVIAGHDSYKCTKSTQECLDMMTADLRAHGWVGLELDKSEAGALSVKRVVPGSPAEAAGFQAGDALLAMNGVRYADEKSKEALMAVRKTMAPGKNVTYTISRGGYEKKVTATLAEVPNEVLAQHIGSHMLDHAAPMAVAKN